MLVPGKNSVSKTMITNKNMQQTTAWSPTKGQTVIS